MKVSEAVVHEHEARYEVDGHHHNRDHGTEGNSPVVLGESPVVAARECEEERANDLKLNDVRDHIRVIIAVRPVRGGRKVGE